MTTTVRIPKASLRESHAAGRPCTLLEMMFSAWQHGWDEALVGYLRQFRAAPVPGALENPPRALTGYYRALIAAVVETLATEQGWEVPAWTQGPDCFLAELHLGLPDRLRRLLSLDDQQALISVMSQSCPEPFRRRGVIVKWNLLHPNE